MSKTRIIIGELVLALVVLALLFLNFGHSGADLRAGANIAFEISAIDASFCGDASADPSHHVASPCHACRLGEGAALPPPPACPAMIEPDTATTAYTPASIDRIERTLRRAAAPRGPPALV